MRAGRAPMGRRLAERLQHSWWQPRADGLALCLRPLSWVYRLAWELRRLWAGPRRVRATFAHPPVLVVGNLVAGGAGKTPTVIELVRELSARGWRPGVVTRGYGARGDTVCEVLDGARADEVGDEALLVRRRTGAPVFVGRRRVDALHALATSHPEVDVVISDDGLQHLALPRNVELVLFDARGVGNGALLPSGPLREPFDPRAGPGDALVLYTAGRASTPWPGALATRTLGLAIPWIAWVAGTPSGACPVPALHGTRALAVAGIAQPQAFFDALAAAGLQVDTLALPDHDPLDPLPWPASTERVLVTEKDAVKLIGRPLGAAEVWVVRLDFALPDSFVAAVLQRLEAARQP